MQTREQIEAEVIARAKIANNSTAFPASRVTQVVKDASLWAGTLFFWPSLFRARRFSTTPNTQDLSYDYYDYPTDMLTGSISRLYINGLKHDKKSFQDFLDYVDQCTANSIAPSNTVRIFAEFGRQIFVFPTVSTAGTNDGIVWGNIQPLDLSTPTATTIFSLWDDSGNEAICKKALSVLMERVDSGFAMTQKTEAIQLLTVIWKKVVTENQKNQKLNPQFNVPDLFSGGTGSSNIGNFSGVDIIF
jgi:hypothetical protein